MRELPELPARCTVRQTIVAPPATLHFRDVGRGVGEASPERPEPDDHPDIPAGTAGTIHSTGLWPLYAPPARQSCYYLVTFADDAHTWEPFWLLAEQVTLTRAALPDDPTAPDRTRC